MAVNRIKLIQALDKLRSNSLYVHNDIFEGLAFEGEELQNRKIYLVETLATINALVDNGTMLLFGGHGGGKTTLCKYLGQMFYHLSGDEIEDCILRGHPQLTEEKILGSLDIAQLTGARTLTEGKSVDVIWNRFVTSTWKIIDEMNRLSPYAQNILLSLLAEGTVKYHNASKVLPPFTLYSTMNPKDEGNFTLSLPFLDRFALALPITMPDYESLLTIGKKGKNMRSESLSSYLPSFNLAEYQEEVRNVIVSDEAEFLINLIISEFRLCLRVTKEANDNITVENTLCNGCHYLSEGKACNKIINPLSVRVKEDLYRYSKAMAWFLGSSNVKGKHVEFLAPYLIWHRSNISRKFKSQLLEKKFESGTHSINPELEAVKELVSIIATDFKYLKEIQLKYNKVKRGELSEEEFDKFGKEVNSPNQNHLLVEIEIRKVLNEEYTPVYNSILKINERIKAANTIDDLVLLKDEMAFSYELPNRQFLVNEIDRKISKVNNDQYPLTILEVSLDTFVVQISNLQNELANRINTYFHGDFKPVLMKPYPLFTAAEDGFDLKMTRLQSKLKFEFQGPNSHRILKFLRDNKIG